MDALVIWRWRVVLMSFALVVLMMSSIVGARPLADDDEIQTHLKSLNKPAIKSIELEDGEIVDCIDIYKQPAFDHPLLKDHKIIMSPSFPAKTSDKAVESGRQPILQSAWQKSEGCPEGTIPIRRVQKSNLLQAPSSKHFIRKDVSTGQIERAGKTLYTDGPYIGSKACLNVWALSVEPDEWSQVAIEVADGHHRDNNKIVLEAGWTVNPKVFGDNRTRVFTSWTVDGYKSTGCYDTLCPGFVQTNKGFLLGGVIDHLSTYDGEQFCFDTTIYMDASNSVWWLLLGEQQVGYWPLCLFKKHGGFEGASRIKWIGSVLNTNKGGEHTTTDMGSGHYADKGWRKAANIDNIQVMKDINASYYKPSQGLALGFSDNAVCYNYHIDDDGYLFLGGPGRGGEYCK